MYPYFSWQLAAGSWQHTTDSSTTSGQLNNQLAAGSTQLIAQQRAGSLTTSWQLAAGSWQQTTETSTTSGQFNYQLAVGDAQSA